MKLLRSILPFLLLSFVAQAQSPVKDGAILAEFSVSDSTKVYFSQGNLQYQASTGTWRFAEHQWDFVGDSINGNVYENGVKSDNLKISPTYDGWIDLFAWGTSGYKDYMPYTIARYVIDVGIFNTNFDWGVYDWGVYNKISNGGNRVKQWRTLDYYEWAYIIYHRKNGSHLLGVANVNGVNGLILLPDNWTLPEGIVFTSGRANHNGREYYATINNYTASEWKQMVLCFFLLPATAYR